MSEVPPWGCPWHGLVKGGQLELPNGDSMAYPQPLGAWYAQGLTRLVAHPGAPEDSRSAEQITADDDSGRQWWQQAVLAGGFSALHGKPLGGGRWLYIDPNGDVWLASTTLSLPTAQANNVQVTLSRFGVLGGRSEQYTYPVPVADPQLGQASPELTWVAPGMTLCDSTCTGDAALFVIHGLLQVGEQYTFPFMPLGWVEISLSGPGAECVVTLEVARTRSQALGSIVSEADMSEAQLYSYSPPPKEPPEDYVTSVDVYIRPYVVRSHQSVKGRILALMYSPEGGLQELTLSVSSVVTKDQTIGYMDFNPDEFNGEFQWETDGAWAISFELAGVALHSENYQWSQIRYSSIESYVSSEDGDGPYHWFYGKYRRTYTGAKTYAGGGVQTFAPDVTNAGWFGIIDAWPDAGLIGQEFSATPAVAAQLATQGISFIYDYDAAASSSRHENIGWHPAMHSLNLYSLAVRVSKGSTGPREFLGTCVTPAGPLELAPVTLESNTARLHGSWCPVTGHALRDTVPICYV